MFKLGQVTNLIILAILFFAAALRVYRIAEVPPSLFGDEIDAGYHAYSVSKTLRDYQGNFLPLHFHSLAEWRTPLFIYSLVPSVTIFGITPLGIRLPAAIFGVLGVYGIYLLVSRLFSYVEFNELKSKNRRGFASKNVVGLMAAFFLTISPWHLQYSRAGFEVTMLLAFLIFGLLIFLDAIGKKGRNLWLSAALLVLCPLIYSTAKLFIPILFLALLIIYKRKIFTLPKNQLFTAVATLVILGIPTAYSTLFGGGAQRAAYTSIFTDPAIEPEVGYARSIDAAVWEEVASSTSPGLFDRYFHNKVVFWMEHISENFLGAFSTNFLFVEGDPNLRHSLKGVGQFYKIEALAMLLGIITFFAGKADKRAKILIGIWALLGALPSALTRDGGNHATRLILSLPPLMFLVSYGVYSLGLVARKVSWRNTLLVVYFIALAVEFKFYIHNYYVHYPWDSQRWWHGGFSQSISEIKRIEKDYEKVIISMSGEPAWIFFAGLYGYPPEQWQKNFPLDNVVEVAGFGKASHIDKYYFVSVPEEIGVYGLEKIIDNKTLYLAVAKEIGANLIKEPDRTPPGLRLLKFVAYPSGDPAFYLFSAL